MFSERDREIEGGGGDSFGICLSCNSGPNKK